MLSSMLGSKNSQRFTICSTSAKKGRRMMEVNDFNLKWSLFPVFLWSAHQQGALLSIKATGAPPSGKACMEWQSEVLNSLPLLGADLHHHRLNDFYVFHIPPNRDTWRSAKPKQLIFQIPSHIPYAMQNVRGARCWYYPSRVLLGGCISSGKLLNNYLKKYVQAKGCLEDHLGGNYLWGLQTTPPWDSQVQGPLWKSIWQRREAERPHTVCPSNPTPGVWADVHRKTPQTCFLLNPF